MQTWFRTDLQPLYRAPLVFASDDPHQTMLAASEALEEHTLVWRPGRVNSMLRQLQIGDISLYLLRYGAGVQVKTREHQDFLLFQVPIAGSAQITVGDARVDADESTGVIVSPGLPLQLEWQEGCEQLLLKIPRDKIERLSRQLFQTTRSEPLQFKPQFALNTWQGHAWQHMLCSLLSWYRTEQKPPSSDWAHAQADMVVQHLLLSQPHNYSNLLERQRRPATRTVRLAEQYIQTHLRAPLDVASIAQAAGASVSGLSAAFKEHHGQSLMAFVRERRLAKVHTELQSAPPGTRITDVALSWGFGHLGRFSAHYRARYGQTPSQTVRR